METVLIVGLLCALIFFLNSPNVKPANPPAPPPQPPQPLPLPKRFVSVVFKEEDKKTYDYFFDDNLNLMVNDFVEVPVRNKFTGKNEYKVVMVKYVSSPGERSEYAWATVIRRVPPPPQKPYVPQPSNTSQSPQIVSPPPQPLPSRPNPLEKRFVQVIFKKHSKKRFDYLLGNNPDIRVGDFVVVHVNNSGKTTWKIAKVVYVSRSDEISNHAKSSIIKKADYPKW